MPCGGLCMPLYPPKRNLSTAATAITAACAHSVGEDGLKFRCIEFTNSESAASSLR